MHLILLTFILNMDWSGTKAGKRNTRYVLCVVISQRDNHGPPKRQQYKRREVEILEVNFVERINKTYDGSYVLANEEGEVRKYS